MTKNERLQVTGVEVGNALDKYLKDNPLRSPIGEAMVCRCLVTCQVPGSTGCKNLKSLDAVASAAGVDIDKMNRVLDRQDQPALVVRTARSVGDVEESKEEKKERERRESAPVRELLMFLAMKVCEGNVDAETADRVIKIVELWREFT